MSDLVDDVDRRLCIVGVGASAGGLEAIREMLASANPETNLAYVVIQHLDPNHESLLAELLGRQTALDAQQVSGGEKLEAGKVYIIPPGHGLSIHEGVLELTEFAQPRGLRRPIDDFFESLALDQGRYAACVILSGTGADGSSGLRAIKEHGGLCIAQAPETARYDGMPNAAKATRMVDFVRRPDQIVDTITQFYAHKSLSQGDTVLSRTVAECISDICNQLYKVVGHDFTDYKPSTLVRRIERRIQVLDLQDGNEYLERLKSDREECETLFRELLINVTRFFRDREHFEVLRDEVIAPLVRDNDGEEIRVWVPGCSSGEEAYSIAMLFSEQVRIQKKTISIQIFATDIDEQMLKIARQGLYPISALADIPEEMRELYTIAREGKFQVDSRIRDMIRFSLHSVVRDPPLSNIDLISCRNLLIYFGEKLQSSALPVFHYAIRPGGTLFLGPSETIGRFESAFAAIDQSARLFRRKDGDSDYPLHLRGKRNASYDSHDSSRDDTSSTRVTWQRGLAADRILKAYAPATVHVTAAGKILGSTGRLSKYLALEPGSESAQHVQALARPGLREAVSALIRRGPESGKRVTTRDLSARSEFGQQQLDLIAEGLSDGTTLLIFQDREKFEAIDDADIEELNPSDSHVQSLEEDLRSTRARLHITVEELETANEELKSSNEEMMSMNEELQSTNEELATVNDELKSKVDQLSVANADLHNFFSSTALPLVVVDSNLLIRNYTEAILEIYPFRRGDRGRPLNEVSSVVLENGEIIQATTDVISGGDAKTLHVRDMAGGTTWSLLITPYRGSDDSIDGATLVFTNLTQELRLEQALAEEGDRLRLALEVTELGVWEYVPSTQTLRLDDTCKALLGLPENAPEDLPIEDTAKSLDKEHQKVFLDAFANASQKDQLDVTVTLQAADGQSRELRLFGRADGSRRVFRVLGVISDVTSQNESARIRELMLREMNHRVKNMFSIISGMLRLVGRSATTVREVVEGVETRVAALARSHNLSQQQSGAPVSLSDVIEATLSPYAGEERFDMKGPNVTVDSGDLSPLSLILHEWATNAAKYGVLGPIEGTLRVSWEALGNGKLEILWNESYSNEFEHGEQKAGFGSMLVQIAADQLDGSVSVDASPNGREMRLTYGA